MKVVFFGYSQMGAVALEVLLAQGHEVVAVVTHEDDPREDRWYRVPAEVAREHGLPVTYASALKGRLGAFTRDHAPDLVLSVFYRDLLPGGVLDAPRLAALNLHPSLLPAYRGRAPINWVLVRGEARTGVTLHHMVKSADAGDIVAQEEIEISPRETALTLYHKVEAAGRRVLEGALPLVAAGTAPRIPQDHARANVVGRRRPEDGRIDWTGPVRAVDCLVRAVAPPWPGAFTDLGGERTFIHEGAPDDTPGALEPPGTLRRLPDGKLYIAAADGWFRVDRAVDG